MARLEMYDVALQLVTALRPVLAQVQTHDRAMAEQIKTAASSVTANIREGARRVGRDRSAHWRYAAGSADEVLGHLDTATAWGDLNAAVTAEARALIDRLLAMLWRATHPR